VGKTTVAIAVAALVQPFFHEGVAFVELATVNDPTQLAATLANTLGLSDSSNKPAQSQLVEFLRRKSMLLVLDNCEQLLPAPHSPPAALESVAARLIADLLAECPNLRVLATSREPLRLRAEQRQSVPPLDLRDAVALFVERAQAVEPEFVLGAPQQPLVEAICNRLDGLPLAIELIAARADLLSPQEMLDRLNQQPLHRLASDLRDLPERHRTLHNAILHSYALLSRTEQQAFRALGLFVGGFDPGSAAAVGVDEMVLRSLVKKSLIRRDGSAEGKDRYTLLEVLRHFALEQLQVENEEAAQRIRHLAYFADYAQAIFKEVRGEQQGEWLRRGRIDHDNFREALRFALKEHHCEQAISIAGGLWWFWYRQGFINEGRSWLAQSLQCAPIANGEAWTPASNDSKRRRAIACNGAGSMASEQGDFESAIASFQAAMALYTDLDDPIGTSAVLHNMGLVASGQGNYAQAMRWLEDSLRLEQRTENPQIALGTANLGITAYEMGDLPLAKEWLEKAWQLAQEEVDTWAQAFIANGMAEVLRAMGDLERATLLAHESLRRFVQLNDQHYLPEPSLILANIALTRGDVATAHREALAVLQQYQELKDDHGIANTLFVLARLTLVESDGRDSDGRNRAIRAATLLGVSIHLRSQVGRRLSAPEERERKELRAAIEQRIGAAETEQLIRNAQTVDWLQMLK